MKSPAMKTAATKKPVVLLKLLNEGDTGSKEDRWSYISILRNNITFDTIYDW